MPLGRDLGKLIVSGSLPSRTPWDLYAVLIWHNAVNFIECHLHVSRRLILAGSGPGQRTAPGFMQQNYQNSAKFTQNTLTWLINNNSGSLASEDRVAWKFNLSLHRAQD